MVHTAFDSRVPYNGQTTVFDIFTGRKSNDGDLKITLTRHPLQVRRGKDRFGPQLAAVVDWLTHRF